MKLFERSDEMRYKWTDKWCDTLSRDRRCDAHAWRYIDYKNMWRKLDLDYRNGWEANHISHMNDRQRADEMTDYLLQGLDENSFDQPFLPRKPFLVGRSG